MLVVYFLIRNLAFYSYQVKEVKSKFHIFFSFAKIHKLSKIYTVCIFIYICIQKLFQMLDKGLRKNIKKKKRWRNWKT